MSPKLFSQSSAPWLARLTIVLAFVSRTLQADSDPVETPTPIPTSVSDVTDVFNVMSGTEKGGCDAYDVNEWFHNAWFFASEANDALMDARNAKARGVTDADSQDEVIAAFMNRIPGDDVPWIFCDSTSAVAAKWSDVALTAGTGAVDAEGRKIQEVYAVLYEENWLKRNRDIKQEKNKAERAKLPRPFIPFWVDALKAYRYAETGDYCSKNYKRNMAGTDDNFQPTTITFCPKNWKSVHYKEIHEFPATLEEEGVSINEFTIEGLTFFHEMFHNALLNKHTPDTAYSIGEITRAVELEDGEFISQEEAIANPESWTLFALAWYLGHRYPDYTFASTESKLK
ncbi:hypothetical protein G7Z17_g885 [Cylindrodendrum hubeiense]|uniref:Uncharacterized protein n=1 Tax=Cylindrodendrum hubeiense TaxID=595255 RepID=A0A9P5HNW2_9HYPO|nr:hypothetical protein G7Z17_g885 [Cylindrodendrum hubeiense]